MLGVRSDQETFDRMEANNSRPGADMVVRWIVVTFSGDSCLAMRGIVLPDKAICCTLVTSHTEFATSYTENPFSHRKLKMAEIAQHLIFGL